MTPLIHFIFSNFIADAPIYEVNSAPQYDLYPQYTAEPGGFRALGVNYNYMSYFYYSIFIISATVTAVLEPAC